MCCAYIKPQARLALLTNMPVSEMQSCVAPMITSFMAHKASVRKLTIPHACSFADVFPSPKGQRIVKHPSSRVLTLSHELSGKRSERASRMPCSRIRSTYVRVAADDSSSTAVQDSEAPLLDLRGLKQELSRQASRGKATYRSTYNLRCSPSIAYTNYASFAISKKFLVGYKSLAEGCRCLHEITDC